jgi:hypothetical protein
MLTTEIAYISSVPVLKGKTGGDSLPEGWTGFETDFGIDSEILDPIPIFPWRSSVGRRGCGAVGRKSYPTVRLGAPAKLKYLHSKIGRRVDFARVRYGTMQSERRRRAVRSVL